MVDISTSDRPNYPEPDRLRFPLLEGEEIRRLVEEIIRGLDDAFSRVKVDLDKVSDELGTDGTLKGSGAKSSDPSDPDTNQFVIWQSDGTGSGADGDLMVKITDSNGTTKTGTIVDYSTL